MDVLGSATGAGRRLLIPKLLRPVTWAEVGNPWGWMGLCYTKGRGQAPVQTRALKTQAGSGPDRGSQGGLPGRGGQQLGLEGNQGGGEPGRALQARGQQGKVPEREAESGRDLGLRALRSSPGKNEEWSLSPPGGCESRGAVARRGPPGGGGASRARPRARRGARTAGEVRAQPGVSGSPPGPRRSSGPSRRIPGSAARAGPV